MNTLMLKAAVVMADENKVCPEAPPGAQQYADDVQAWVMWGVIALLVIGGLVSIGAVAAGRVFNMPHAGKMGVVGVVVMFLAAIGYLIVPGMITGTIGTGCI